MENWRYINGFEGRYMISDLGRVKSCKREYKDSLGRRYVKESQILKPQYSNSKKMLKKNASKRVTIGLRKDGKKKSYQVSRLVAEAFIPNPEKKETVNHIDGNTENNHKDNLEWMTRSENVEHGYDNDLYPNVVRPMIGINVFNGTIIQTKTLTDMASLLMVSTSAVRECAKENMKREKMCRKSKGYYLGYLSNPKRNYAGKVLDY